MNFRLLVIAGLLGGSFTAAHANALTYSATAVPTTLTNWSTFADLQQFNPALGTLQQVTLSLAAELSGSAKVERRDTNNSTKLITADLQAKLTLANPNNANQTLLEATPVITNSFSSPKYDGVTNYLGASGRSYVDLHTSVNQQASFTDAATLSLFTGTGTLYLPFSATGQSKAAGSGNMAYLFTTNASGTASVTYSYQATAVPEPGTWALMFSGLGMIGMLASRRRA